MLLLVLDHTLSKATSKKKKLLSTHDIHKALKINPMITWHVSVSPREMGMVASEGGHVCKTQSSSPVCMIQTSSVSQIPGIKKSKTILDRPLC